MRKTILFALVFGLIVSCSKSKTKVDYPNSTSYGKNILAVNSSDTLDPNLSYSFNAFVSKKASLRIELTNLFPNFGVWSYDSSSNDGWIISDYNFGTGKQTFENATTGNLNLKIMFTGYGGMLINVYENQTSSPIEKIIYW